MRLVLGICTSHALGVSLSANPLSHSLIVCCSLKSCTGSSGTTTSLLTDIQQFLVYLYNFVAGAHLRFKKPLLHRTIFDKGILQIPVLGCRTQVAVSLLLVDFGSIFTALSATYNHHEPLLTLPRFLIRCVVCSGTPPFQDHE